MKSKGVDGFRFPECEIKFKMFFGSLRKKETFDGSDKAGLYCI